MIQMTKPYTKEIVDGVECLRHRNGSVYTATSLTNAVEVLKNTNRPLKVEFGCPKLDECLFKLERVNRFFTVRDECVCGEIDPTTIEFKDGVITANITPTGPFAEQLVQLTQKQQPEFSMRSSTNQQENNVLEVVRIFTFDLDLSQPPQS